ESSITAGLCMANRGGSGDLEVLSACNRMNLISYAQISSRLGGENNGEDIRNGQNSNSR
uniref:2-hydroxycarboxylate transporter family protein n=1 Tax=Salmonella enterica TaxID=28901 RepID=UPI0011316409